MDRHSSDVETSATISSAQEDDHSTMVSALTGRLFAVGGHDVASLDSFKKRKAERMMSSTNTSGGSSGYAADVDQMSKGGHPPSYVDLLMRPRGDDKAASTTEIIAKVGLDKLSAKRRKIIEREFTAHSAKEALARAGATKPTVRINSPRVLPPQSGVDMSRVSLVKSSDFSFINRPAALGISTKVNGATSKSNQKKEEDKEICFESIISLTEACKAFYKLPPPAEQQEDASRSDDNSTNSTASSVTDSDPDCEPEEGVKPFMAMCEALSLCKQPRIVVLASAPFTVVHVNAAYLQLSGLSSVRLLGQPFQDLILDGKWTAAMSHTDTEGNGFDLRKMHKQEVKARTGVQKGSPLQCTVTASPIGVSEDRITHFALVLDNLDKEDNSGDEAVDLSMEENCAPAMTVAG